MVGNQGDNFSAGANLQLLVEQAKAGDWEAIRDVVVSFQAALDRLERCAVPVVTAPQSQASASALLSCTSDARYIVSNRVGARVR